MTVATILAVALIYVVWYATYETPTQKAKQKTCKVKCSTCKCGAKK